MACSTVGVMRDQYAFTLIASEQLDIFRPVFE